MRPSIIPPAFTASTGLDVTVVSSSSVTPEPARASRKRPKYTGDVILAKFVLLVSVHTTSVNETRVKSKGGVDLVAMDDVSMLTNYAHSDWLIVSVRDLFIEIL